MADRPILFLDSGAGGLPYVEAVRELLPEEQVVYIADTAHFPYGTREAEDIRNILVDLVARSIKRFSPGIIVLACNTATVLALAELRGRFDVPFVGVVPAVKPAARLVQRGTVAILATDRTADAEYLAELVEDHADGASVEILAAGGLVTFVEERLPRADAAARREAVSRALAELPRERLDAVVLGCTHFTHLATEIAEEVGDDVRVIDSREGVARRVASLLGVDGACRAGRARAGGRLHITGEGDDRYALLARAYDLSFEGRLL